MADSSSRGTLLVVAGALVQCFFYGLYTALFLLSATFTFFSRHPRRWILLLLNTMVYLVSTATLYYDLVMTCVSVETLNTVRLYRLAEGEDPGFLRARISLFIVISTLTESLIVNLLRHHSSTLMVVNGQIWRLSRLWIKAIRFVVLVAFLNILVAGSGLVLAHIQRGPELTFRYDVYRRAAFSSFACFMVTILVRSCWMSKQLHKLYGSHIHAYTFTGACIDSGLLFIVPYALELGLTSRDIPILRPVLPQFAGMTATLILFQESLGRSAQDLGVTVRAIQEAEDGRSTPILDTLFSTPGASIQFTGGQGGRSASDPRSHLDASFLGSRSMFSVRSHSQLAMGDEGFGEARKSNVTIDTGVVEEIRQPEKIHG